MSCSLESQLNVEGDSVSWACITLKFEADGQRPLDDILPLDDADQGGAE